MALTLVEAAKKMSGDVIRSAVIEEYARQSDVLRVLPFENIAGNALRYNRGETLPGIGFRGVNEAYSESVGVLNPVTEPLVIAGGDLDVDKFIVRTMGGDQRATHEMGKVRALAHAWTKKFIKGDSTSDAREFDGLQVRLTGDQLVDNDSATSALKLSKLDELIDAVDSPSALIMNRSMRRRLTAAARTTTVGGDVRFELDSFGRRVTEYNGLPILIADEDEAGNQILPFTESGSASGTDATSLYCVSFEENGLVGLQNGAIEVTDLGELDTKPVLRTRVEWYSGIAIFRARAAARLMGVTDAAAVA